MKCAAQPETLGSYIAFPKSKSHEIDDPGKRLRDPKPGLVAIAKSEQLLNIALVKDRTLWPTCFGACFPPQWLFPLCSPTCLPSELVLRWQRAQSQAEPCPESSPRAKQGTGALLPCSSLPNATPAAAAQ